MCIRDSNDVEYYFQLKKTNDSLVKANETLYNKLRQDFEMADTVSRLTIDTIKIDTLLYKRKYLYLPSKVVGNSVSLTNNYLELHRGSQQGVARDLGVTDINNSVVMSLLHRQSNISAKLKKSGETGSIIWDGVQPNVVILKDISKEVKIAKGDTVITSGFSDKFPYGLLIGTVKDIENDRTSSTYTIRVKTAANFYNLQYVYVINNLQKEAPEELLKKVKKTNE